MQCKDIPDKPILKFLVMLKEQQLFGTWFGPYHFPNSVGKSMPEDTPRKLILAKMKQMIHRGVVNGCSCGCRGDFEITEKGLKELGDK